MFYYCLNTNSPTVASPNHFFLEEHMFSEELCIVREFAIGLVLVISCEPVKVEKESRNFSALEAQHVYKLSMSGGNETGIPVPIFWPTCIGTSPF